MYELNEKIKTRYVPNPVSKDWQYMIGEEVQVFDTQTREVIATFIVETTDEYEVTGTINWVKE